MLTPIQGALGSAFWLFGWALELSFALIALFLPLARIWIASSLAAHHDGPLLVLRVKALYAVMDPDPSTTDVSMLPGRHPPWDQHSGGAQHREPDEWEAQDLEIAQAFYIGVRGETWAFLDISIDNPTQRGLFG